MKLCNHIKFDLITGLWKRGMWIKYLFWLAFFVLACWEFSGKLSSLEITYCTYGDYFLYIFGGMKEYIPIPGEPFQVPYLWLINHIGVLYFTLHYMHDDLEGFGQQVIVRSDGRRAWWLSKCVWNVTVVMIFYILAWGTMFLCASCHGAAPNLDISPFMPELMVVGPEMIVDTGWRAALEITIMPLLVTMAMSLFQMLLCLLIRPTFSYIISVVLFISSAYYLSPYLFGNYSMALRSDGIISNGVALADGICLYFIVMVLSIVLGIIIFQKINILSKEE